MCERDVFGEGRSRPLIWRNRRERFVVFYADDYRRGSLRSFRKRAERDITRRPGAALFRAVYSYCYVAAGVDAGEPANRCRPVLTVWRRTTIKTAWQTKAGTIISREISSRFSSNCSVSLPLSSHARTRSLYLSPVRALWPEHAVAVYTDDDDDDDDVIILHGICFCALQLFAFPVLQHGRVLCKFRPYFIFRTIKSRATSRGARVLPPPPPARPFKKTIGRPGAFSRSRAIVIPRPKTS